MKKLKFLLLLISIFSSSQSHGHGGDSGPSILEEEFSKLSHLHLPFNFSTLHGVSFGYSLESHEEDPSHDSSDKETDPNHDESNPDHTGLDLDIHPVVFAGADKIKRLTALEKSSGANFYVEKASENSPYLMLENKKWDLGLGLEIDKHLPAPLFTIGGGVSKLISRNYYSIKYLKEKNERRAKLKIPFNLDELKNWRQGDKISYATQGNLIFNVFVGIEPLIHIGPEYIHSGSYRVSIWLSEHNKMNVEIVTTKTKAIGIEGSAIIAGFEWMKSKGHLNSVVYEFDLDHPESIEAMKLLFNGRIDLTNEKMLTSPQNIIFRSNLENNSHSRTSSISIPVIYFKGRSKGVYQTSGTLETTENDEHNEHDENNENQNHEEKLMESAVLPNSNEALNGFAQIEDFQENLNIALPKSHIEKIFSTTFINEKFTRGILSKHQWESKILMTSIIREPNHQESILSNIYSISYSSDKVKSAKIYRKLQSLANLLQIPQLKHVRFPYNQLGHLKLDLVFNFSGEEILYLLNLTNLENLKTSAITKMKNDFIQKGHQSFCRLKNKIKCLNTYINSMDSKYLSLKTLAKNIDLDYENESLKSISFKINQMMKIILGSKYYLITFKEIFPKLDVELRLEGEKIKKTLIEL